MLLASTKNSSRMPSWHPPDSDSGMVQDDESIIKVHNIAKTRFSWIWPFGIWTILMYKIYNNLMPSNILSYFCMVHMSHDHDTRQAGHFKNMYCRTTLKSMCLSIRGPDMWNKLHSDLKNSITVNMFKKRYKTFLVSEYEAT